MNDALKNFSDRSDTEINNFVTKSNSAIDSFDQNGDTA